MDDSIDKIIEQSTRDLKHYEFMVDHFKLRIKAFKALKKHEEEEKNCL